jgi:hypothetical protein
MKTLKVFFFGFVFLFILTSVSYRIWRGSQTILAYSDTLSQSIIQPLNAPKGMTLVPKGCIWSANEVDELTYQYEIDVQSGYELKITSFETILIKNGIKNIDYKELINIISTIEMVNATRALVTVKVSIRMPESQEEYSLIQGSSVSFSLKFDQILLP